MLATTTSMSARLYRAISSAAMRSTFWRWNALGCAWTSANTKRSWIAAMRRSRAAVDGSGVCAVAALAPSSSASARSCFPIIGLPRTTLRRRMYRHCIYCKSDLGSNEVIEHFPLGRRLAFDGERGRLWVICRHCRRWNLSPIEERWEAIEDCERQYRKTTTRLATEHIGLARLPEGLDLVRIGRPQRPEFAAWRYGDQLVQRRRRTWVLAGVGVADRWHLGRRGRAWSGQHSPAVPLTGCCACPIGRVKLSWKGKPR